MQGKKVLFIALFSLFIGIAAYDLGLFGTLSGQEPAIARGGQQRMPRLMLDLLEKQRPGYTGVKRDIFSFPRPKVAAVAKPPEPPPAEAMPVAPPAPPPPTELQTFASQASYMGGLSKQAAKTVFIISGNEVLAVKKGDVIGARFMVEEITDDLLLLRDNSTGEEARIIIRTETR